MNNEYEPGFQFDERWFRATHDSPEMPMQPVRRPESNAEMQGMPGSMGVPWPRRRSEEMPFVVNIENAALLNDNFRRVVWTGDHMQLTLMSINVGEDIGLEIHPNLDQFLRIEQGVGIVEIGNNMDNPEFRQRISENFAIIIPAGTWHNIINAGRVPLKLYSIYAPPQHPPGTIQATKAEAQENH